MKNGDIVLLVSEERNYVVRIQEGKMNTSNGQIDFSKFIKKKIGDKIKTSSGFQFTICKPTNNDIIRKYTKRSAQVMLPKDIFSIISNTGIFNNSLIVDSGTGSGFTSIYMSKIFPNSKIITYEIDKKFYQNAKNNLSVNNCTNVKIKNKNILNGIQEKKVDLIILDLKESPDVIKLAYKSLNVGGWISVYSPTVNHLIKVNNSLIKFKFKELKIIENMEREWQFTKTIRPKTMGIMHTGFLTFARKFI